jgi:hypothetical protein
MPKAAAILCVTALALAGCGGSASTTKQFEGGYAAARAPLNQTFDDVSSTLATARGKSSAEVAASIDGLAARFSRELAPLHALKPPPAAALAFTTLTSSLDRVGGDLRGISSAVKRRDLGGVQLAVESLQSDARAAALAARAIEQKLYTS